MLYTMTRCNFFVAAFALSMVAPPTKIHAAQEEEVKAHRRLIPKHPNQPNIRQLITEKINRQEETLTRMIYQRQSAINDHISGRKLLPDEGLEYHKTHIASLRHKRAIAKQKDPAMRELEIEHEVQLHEKMLHGEFIWTPGESDLVLRE